MEPLRPALEHKGLRFYSAYGLTFSSNFSLRIPAAGFPKELDFSLARISAPPTDGAWTGGNPAYRSPYQTTDGRSILYLYRHEGFDLLRLPETADFYLYDDRILCLKTDSGDEEDLELDLLG